MRYFVLAAFLSVTCLGAAQNTSVHITYSTRAARASRVIKDIGAIAKLDLEVSPQTQNEVLVISVKDTPLSDLMARIATATSGEWRTEGSVYRLVGSSTMRKQEEREQATKRIANVRKAIDKAVLDERKRGESDAKAAAEAAAKAKADAKADPKGKNKDGGTESSILSNFIGSNPASGAITALIREIDPAVFAQIGPGDRIVFSTDPTHAQRTLGSNATEIINELIQKHDAVTADAQPDLAQQFAGMSEQQAELMRQVMSRQHTGKIGQVAKALLIASNSELGAFMSSDSIELELRLYNAKGKVVFTGNNNLTLKESDALAAMESMAASTVAVDSNGTVTAVPVPAKQPEPQTKQTPIDYSADSKALQKSTKGMTTGKFNLDISRELRQKLFLPNMYDPLSFMQTDEVLAYAKLSGKPLVADIPDSAMAGFEAFGGQSDKTVESLTKEIKSGTTMVAVADDTFTVLKPSEPAQSRAERLDRLALATLMQATQDKGVPSLDDMSAYASVAPNPMGGGIGRTYLLLYVPGGSPMGMDGMTSWEMLRFYADLTPDIRNQLSNGGKLPISSLTSGQRAQLERMTYGAGAQLSVDDPQKKQDDDTPFWMNLAGGSATDDYRGEPTESVPNGLPGSGYVELKSNVEPFAAPVPGTDSTMMAMLGILGPDELAMFKMLRSTPGAEQITAMFPKFPKLKVGERTIYKFTFHVAPQVSIKQTLKDHRLGKDANTYSEDNLPADLQKRVADRAEALKKSPMGAIGSFMGGGQAIHP